MFISLFSQYVAPDDQNSRNVSCFLQESMLWVLEEALLIKTQMVFLGEKKEKQFFWISFNTMSMEMSEQYD